MKYLILFITIITSLVLVGCSPSSTTYPSPSLFPSNVGNPQIAQKTKPTLGFHPLKYGSTVQQTQVLSTSRGTWNNCPGSTCNFTYTWQHCFPNQACTNVGTNSSTYTIAQSDIDSTLRVVVTATNTAGAAIAVSNTTPIALAHCDVYASPTGTGSGSLSNPYGSIATMENAMSAGQTGCVEPGSYGGVSTSFIMNTSGSSSANGQILITAQPGTTPATVQGFVESMGSYVTLSHLNINESGNGSMQINGVGDTLTHNNISGTAGSNNSGIGIGWNPGTGMTCSADPSAGCADNVVISYNKIHDFGSNSNQDHIIYLAHSDHAQIYDNWLWNDAHGWGIQVYPAANYASIHSNVIDQAGSGFVIGNSTTTGNGATHDNTVTHNVVLNSVGVPPSSGTCAQAGVAVTDSWAASPGANNNFTVNDQFGNSTISGCNSGLGSPSNVTTANNISVDPGMVSVSGHNFALVFGSSLGAYGLWDGTNTP